MQQSSTAVLLLQCCSGRELQMPRQQLLDCLCQELSSGKAAIWQATQLQQLLQATPAGKGARAAVLTAAAEGMFNSDSAATLQGRQTDESMLLLSQLLLGDAELAGRHCSRFATAVAQRRSNYSLLKQLLQQPPVRAALELPGVQQLVACQVAHLQRMAAVPAFSWHMPQATLQNYSYPQVQAFLRGPGETFTLSGCFSGIADARKAVCELLGKSSRYGYGSSFGQGSCIESSYSISAEARGTGRNAHVVIRKTQAWHQAQVKHKEGHQQELQAVSQLLRKPAAAAAAAAAAAVPADVRPVADSGVVMIDLTSD